MGIVHIRLDGADDDVQAAVALLEEALGEILHLGAPRASSVPKYAGSWLARGTLQIDRRPQRNERGDKDAT